MEGIKRCGCLCIAPRRRRRRRRGPRGGILANASSFMGAVIFSAYRKPTASRRHPSKGGNLAPCPYVFARATRSSRVWIIGDNDRGKYSTVPRRRRRHTFGGNADGAQSLLYSAIESHDFNQSDGAIMDFINHALIARPIFNFYSSEYNSFLQVHLISFRPTIVSLRELPALVPFSIMYTACVRAEDCESYVIARVSISQRRVYVRCSLFEK